jgi:hypothetical protein
MTAVLRTSPASVRRSASIPPCVRPRASMLTSGPDGTLPYSPISRCSLANTASSGECSSISVPNSPGLIFLMARAKSSGNFRMLIRLPSSSLLHERFCYSLQLPLTFLKIHSTFRPQFPPRGFGRRRLPEVHPSCKVTSDCSRLITRGERITRSAPRPQAGDALDTRRARCRCFCDFQSSDGLREGSRKRARSGPSGQNWLFASR